jgi:hypothetical protein
MTTIQRIRQAISNGNLTRPFRAADVNRVLQISWGGNFLAKHRKGNPGGYRVFFVRVTRGLYR